MNIIFELSDVFYEPNDKVITFENESNFIGQVITNRIGGIVYLNLQKCKYSLSREVDNALAAIYSDYLKRSEVFKANIQYIAKILKDARFQYALLKGALLTTELYLEGQRISNDIDILINKDSVSELQQILKDNGFTQGRYSRKERRIIPATRRDIINASMNYGETVSFIKLINDVPLTIDINFSFDFKSSKKEMVETFLNNRVCINKGNYAFYTLDFTDFFIHLCCHLYKEATTFNWVSVHTDLKLYKFSDINLFLRKMGDSNFFKKLYDRIIQFRVEKECYYAMVNAAILYPAINDIENFKDFIQSICPNNLNFMKQVIYPIEKKLYQYNMDFLDWFFCPDRIAQLEEIPYVES